MKRLLLVLSFCLPAFSQISPLAQAGLVGELAPYQTISVIIRHAPYRDVVLQGMPFPGGGMIHEQTPPSPVTFDTSTHFPYASAGTNSQNHTASGSNITAIACFIARGTFVSASYNGVAMTLSVSHSGTISFTDVLGCYVLKNVPAGTSAVVVVTLGTDVEGWIFTYDNTNTSTQPDSVAAYVTGMSSGAMFSAYLLPITTATDNSAMVGLFSCDHTFTNTPSSNGTFVGATSTLTGVNFWRTTSNITPAGSFSLQALAGTNTVANCEALGVAIRP